MVRGLQLASKLCISHLPGKSITDKVCPNPDGVLPSPVKQRS
ncbi:MAG: hypothetical protein SNJ67_09545 [Chloracidobacterium sp.]